MQARLQSLLRVTSHVERKEQRFCFITMDDRDAIASILRLSKLYPNLSEDEMIRFAFSD